MRKFLLGALGVVILGAALLYSLTFFHSVQDTLLRTALDTALRANTERPWIERDGLHLILCGTGSPLPDQARAASCTLIIAGGKSFLFDAGAGASRKLPPLIGQALMPQHVFLTHFHSDHISDLGDIAMMSWAAGREKPFQVYGPPGVERVARGFEEAYALDSFYRTEHHGEALMPPSASRLEARTLPLARSGVPRIVYEEEGVRITAFYVNHDPIDPAYGYRVDYQGRSILISGDTIKHPNVSAVGKGADIMLHEALNREMMSMLADALVRNGGQAQAQLMRDTLSYHTSPVEAAQSANEAEARLLIYTHIVPPLFGSIAERIFLRGVSDIRPEGVMIGEDGLYIYLPPKSEEIEIDNLL